MSTSFGLAKLLRRLGGNSASPKHSPHRHRPIRLEHLEPRFVLAAPVANPDTAFGNVNTVEFPADVQILALNNDTDSDTLHSVLKIAEVHGIDVSGATDDVSIDLPNGTLNVIFQNAHLEHFTYVPDLNYTGTETFTYKISDGTSLSNAALVTINVSPVADAGDQYTIYEGGLTFDTHEGLVLDGSGSYGPGLTYTWFIGGDQIGPSNSFSPTLSVSWEDLNAIGIVDGNVSEPVTLQVQDANGKTDSHPTGLGVVDFSPSVSVFDLQPVGGEGCGDVTYHMVATFAEPNPLESPFEVWIDWNFDPMTESFFDGVTDDAQQLFGYVPDGFDEFGFPQFTIEAEHPYATGSYIPLIWVLAPGYTFPDPELGQFLSEVGFNLIFPPLEVTAGGGSPPVASADTPAAINEGSGVTITAHVSGSAAPEELIWSLSNGTTTITPLALANADPANPIFNITIAQLASLGVADDGLYSLTLDAVPECGCPCADPNAVDVDVTVTNVAPVVAPIAGPATAVRTQTLVFSGSFTDVPADANATMTWSVSGPAVIAPGSGSNFEFTPSVNGTYTVQLVVNDLDGGIVTVTAPLTVSDSAVVAGTTFSVHPLTGNLTVDAPATDDTISLSNGSLIVTVGAQATKFEPAPPKVTINGGNGNDMITVGPGVTSSVVINGGAGADILVGGDGDDLLVGGAGRDILIGGDGKDALHGKAEDDILISGKVVFATNLSALADIQSEWLSSNNFIVRTANIEGWGCNPTTYQLNSTTVLDDNKKDTLTGDQGTDWFFANLWLGGNDDATKKDQIVDVNLFELLFANDLDF